MTGIELSARVRALRPGDRDRDDDGRSRERGGRPRSAGPGPAGAPQADQRHGRCWPRPGCREPRSSRGEPPRTPRIGWRWNPAIGWPISGCWRRAASCSSSWRSCSRRAIRRSTRPPAISGRSCSVLRSDSSQHRSSGWWSSAATAESRIVVTGPRAIRRGAWVFLVTVLFVVLRLNQVFQPPIALFVLALVAFAEATLSVER